MTVAIRRAASGDIPDMVALVNLAFQVQHDILAGERTSHAEVRRLMEDSAFLVAVEDHAMVGVVQLQANGATGYLGMMAVAPRFRRTGIGRALLDAAENYCRGQGCTEVTLTTASIRPALIEYYGRSGFQIIGIEAQPDDLRFKSKFEFVRMAKTLWLAGAQGEAPIPLEAAAQGGRCLHGLTSQSARSRARFATRVYYRLGAT